MDELTFARETLAAVRALLQLGAPTEWVLRMMLSRLYYAAHHLGRALLRHAGENPDAWRGDVHRRVRQELARRYVRTGRIRQAFMDDLERLRRFRTYADYELRRVIRRNQVDEALELLERLLAETTRILGV